MRPRVRGPAAAGLAALAAVVLLPPAEARAVYECGGETDDCPCGRDNFCICCDGTCGNCVWHAWHSACCGWDRALEWCTDAGTWNDYASSNGYPLGGDPRDSSIFVCEPSGSCSSWGHVGWVVTAHADGSFDTTEQACGGPCGTHSRTRGAGYATGGFIYNPAGDPPPPPDGDGDGYASDVDCNDGDASVHPGAAEACNDRDDDCDGETDEGVRNRCGGCGPEPAETCDGSDNDCDGETDEGVRNRCGGCGPEPAEVCDGADNDCDGETDEGCAPEDAGTEAPRPPEDGATDPGEGGPGDGAGDGPREGISFDVPPYDGGVDAAADRAGDGGSAAAGGLQGGCGCALGGPPGPAAALALAGALGALAFRRGRGARRGRGEENRR